MSKPAIIKCRTCRQQTDFYAEPMGPFCSVRCKMIDLGAWLDEENRISEPLRPEHFQEYEDLTGGTDLDRPEAE